MDALERREGRRRVVVRRAHRTLPSELRRHAREADRASRRHRLDRHRHSRARERRVGIRRVADADDATASPPRRAKRRRSRRRIAFPARRRSCSRRRRRIRTRRGRARIEIDPFTIPDRAESAAADRREHRGDEGRERQVREQLLFFIKEDRNYANTDGSFITQTVIRSWVPFTATAVSPDFSDFQSRGNIVQPAGRGWEFILAADLVGNARKWGEEAAEKLKAKPVDVGRYDLVLHPSHLWLTIHESIGHPTELDRAMGYEANYAGTSFVAPPEKVLGTLKYGPEFMNIQGDRTQEGGCATIGYDDDGVKAESFLIIKNGMFHDYQTSREQAPWLDWYYKKNGHAGEVARLLQRRQLEQRAVPAHAERVAAAGCRRQEVGGSHRRDRQRHRDHRRRLVLDRPAALQRAVRRTGVLRDQGRQDHRHAEGRRLSDEDAPTSGTRWT